ncbi:MAG: Ig-like domain repeat protein, partial [Rhodoferax sp.]|nr:Ig-like domain repeat protein [Rhodoferax sp.]
AVQVLYQVYDDRQQFQLGATGTAGSKLVLPASLGSGWVLVQVSDTNDSATRSKPDYLDEYSRAPQSLDAPLRAWAEVTQGALTAVSVTPLTELAVRLLEQAVQQGSVALNADSMSRYNAQVAGLFGISASLTSSVQPLVDGSGNSQPGNAYGQALQHLSALASARIFGSQSTALAWFSKELSAASGDAARQHIVNGYLAEAEKLLDDQSLLGHPFSRSSLDAPLQFSIHQAAVASGAAQRSDGGSGNTQPEAQDTAQTHARLPFADAQLSPGEVSASATLLLPVPLPPQALAGDVLTLTLHGLQADSSLPVQTVLYTVQGSDALSNYASIPLSDVPAAWWSAAMGQRIGMEAQLSGAARQDGLATSETLTSAAYSVLPGGVLVGNLPATPVLQAGEGVADGATAAEASQASGVLWLTADSGASVSVTFSDGTRSISKTLIGQGSAQALVLDANDMGIAAHQLHDGSISVVAIASNSAGLSSAPAATSFSLDSHAPQIQSFLLEASKTDGTPLTDGNVLFFTSSFDENVVGTPVAPTLTIGSETGIALTPLVTTGATRSWIYTIRNSGPQPDRGAVSVVLDSSSSGLTDAAGNAVDAAADTLVLPSVFGVDTSTPATPVLTLGAGVANGATAAEASQGSGLFSFTAQADSTVTLQLQDGSGHRISKTFSASGSAEAVALEASDIASPISSGANQLHDGPISVFALSANAAGNSSSASLLSLYLDTVAPQLQSAVLSSSRSVGSAAALGDELTYTLSYDSEVFGTVAPPTLTIGSETGIALTPVISSGASRSWRYVLDNRGTPDSGAIAVVAGNYITDITDAAGNPAVDATASNGSHGGSGSSNGEFTPPAAPLLVLGEGVADGASALEAVQASGVLLLTAEAGSTVRVRFSDGQHTVAQTVVATGSAQPLVLGAADVGLSLTALRDGPIAVWAVASNAAGLSSPASLTSFTLDTTGPQLLGVAISADKSESTALSTGDVLTITASYDAVVYGTPTAPTLAIGLETGIALTPVVTSGATRSWRYTLSASDTPDNGAIALEGGNFTSTLHDAAGNPAFYPASDTPAYTGFYRANSNSLSAPVLHRASGVAQAVNAAEATAARGLLSVSAQPGSSVLLRFTDSQANSINKTLLATGSEQAVLLDASDMGNGPEQLHDGNIRVSATAQNSAGTSGSSNTLEFLLDTTAPAAPVLALTDAAVAVGAGVAHEVSRAVALQASGVLHFQAEAGSSVTLRLSDSSNHSIRKTLVATGSLQTLTLEPADLGGGSGQLGDGPILVTALASDAVGNVSSAGANSTLSFHLDTSAPATTLSAVAFSSDTAAANDVSSGSNSDRVTKTATQTISASLSAALPSGETLQASLDGGASWSDISSLVSGQSLNWTGVNLLAGANTLQFRLLDRAGNAGVVQSLAYELDTTAPASSASALSFSNDSGADASDFTTRVAQQSISASLSAAPAAGETLYGSLDDGAQWTDLNPYLQGNTLRWSGVTLLDGSHTLLLKISDRAGNDGPTTRQDYVLDRSAPAVPVLQLGSGIADGATLAEAMQASGVLLVSAEPGSQVTVDFGTGIGVSKTLRGTGEVQVVTLDAADVAFAQANHLQWNVPVQVTVSDTAGNSSTASSSLLLDANPPTARIDIRPSVQNGGASLAEATDASGVFSVSSASGASVLLTLSDGTHTLTQSWVSDGSAHAVTLSAADLGSQADQLQDGTIRITAEATDSAGNRSSVASASFTLDSVAPTAQVRSQTGLPTSLTGNRGAVL